MACICVTLFPAEAPLASVKKRRENWKKKNWAGGGGGGAGDDEKGVAGFNLSFNRCLIFSPQALLA